MKLLIQSDDYGITKRVADGIIDGIKQGVIRNTGLFVNMPWAQECVDKIRPYMDNIAFGQDLNVCAGNPCADTKDIPSLLQDNGSFLTSEMNRRLDKDAPNNDHVIYDEILIEFKAQIDKFIGIVGKKPDYLHPHAYFSATSHRAMSDCGKEYGIPVSFEVSKKYDFANPKDSWYKDVRPGIDQKSIDVTTFIVEDKMQLLNHDYASIICHAGYADDEELEKLTTFTQIREKDLEAMVSAQVKEWIESNGIELITYKDLK
ncbi:MAG: ChbG/HpnK family deacetylase [Anaerorhabdus sp.]